MKKLYAILSLGLIACSGELEERPKPADLISQSDLIPLLIEVQMVESHYQRLYSRPDVFKEAFDSATNIVFEDHDISRSQFEGSYDYYSQDPNEMFSLYEATLDTLNMRISDRQQQVSAGEE